MSAASRVQQLSPGAVRRVCVFGNPWPGGLGDRIIFNAFLAMVGRAFPGAELTYVANQDDVSRFREFFTRHSYAHHVLACPDPADQDPVGWRRLRSQLTSGAFDVCVFDPNGQETMATLAVEAGIGLRIGLLSGSATDALLTRSARMRLPDGEDGSDLLDYAQVLAGLLDLPEPAAADVAPPFPFRPEPLPELLSPVVAVHPGGAPGWNRRWPLDRFADLCLHLVRTEGASMLLLGDSRDATELEWLREAVRAAEPAATVVVSMGESLDRLAGLINRADVLVGNDSAPAHIAGALGTPAVVLYGPASHEFFWRRIYPAHRAIDHHDVCEYHGQDGGPMTMPCRYSCHYPFVSSAGPYPVCLRSISVEDVLQAVSAQLMVRAAR